jgi:methyl-accepting chemotaxis protein
MNIIEKFNTEISLKTKFIIYFSLFALLPILLLGVIVYTITTNINKEDSFAHLHLEADLVKKGYVNLMDAYANMQDYLINDAGFGEYLTGDRTLQAGLLADLAEARKDLSGAEMLFVIDISGKVILDSENNTYLGTDYSDREYLAKIKQTGQKTFSQARKNERTGKPTLVCIDSIKSTTGSTVGYMGFVVDLATLSDEIISDIKILDTGYVVAIENSTMNCVLNADKTKILSDYQKQIPGFAQAVANKNTNSLEYIVNGSKKMCSFSTAENLDWTFVAAADMNDVMRLSGTVLMTMIITAVCVFIAAALFSMAISQKIIRPINRVSEAMGHVAGGDLTVELKMDGKDEVIVMSQNLDKTVHALNGSVDGVKQVASSVETFSGALTLTTEQMAAATSEVTSAIQDVAQGATAQASDLSEVVGILNVFATELDTINASAGHVRNTSHEAEGKAAEAKDQVAELSSSIVSIGQSFSAFMQTIAELGVSVGKIGDITDAINAISDQTNLLALNAAIEAARAGEQGKGFAVVADEVRNLAAESKRSSEEIMELIRRVSQETQGVIKASEEVSGLLSNQERVISKTVGSFQTITDTVHLIALLIDKAKESINSAVQAKDGMVRRVENAAAVSEEVSASAGQIAASSEQLLSSIEEVSGVSGKMNKAVRELVDRVKQYKTTS